MSGYVTVAVRTADGQVVCQKRRIGATPGWLLHPGMLTGEASWIADYLSVTEEEGRVVAACALCPADYGLVVVDHAAKAMLALQSYTDYRRIIPARLQSVDADDSFGFAATALALVQSGRLRLVQRERSESSLGKPGGWQESHVALQPSLPHLAQAARAAEEQHEANYQAMCAWQQIEREIEHEFQVSLEPLAYHAFAETLEGARAFLEKLRSSGFSVNAEAERGWTQWLDEARSVSDQCPDPWGGCQDPPAPA